MTKIARAPNYHDIAEYAATLPSQGGVEIGPWLDRLAQGVPEGAAIVELGCWLGGGTAHLALGSLLSEAPVHTFDRWSATNQEVQKARRYGIALKENMDTLPLVQELLRPIPAAITYHRCNIKEVEWRGGRIGLFVDDATKVEPLWSHAMSVFKPHFIDGAMLVLMDYYFYESAGERYAAQKRYMADHAKEFTLIEERMAGTTAAVFRYRK